MRRGNTCDSRLCRNRALACSRIRVGRWAESWDICVSIGSRKVIFGVAQSHIDNHDSFLQLRDVKVRGRTIGTTDINITVVGGKVHNVDSNRFEVAKQRPRKMMHKMTYFYGPISKALVVH